MSERFQTCLDNSSSIGDNRRSSCDQPLDSGLMVPEHRAHDCRLFE